MPSLKKILLPHKSGEWESTNTMGAEKNNGFLPSEWQESDLDG
jgi:hypothetical protein